MSDEVASITLEQLLTMTSGIGGGSGGATAEIEAKDYIAEVLRHGTQAKPGTQFLYSDNAANVLAAVLTEALRRHDGDHPRTLLDYGRQKLFDPLGADTTPAYTKFEGNDPFSRRWEQAGFGWATDRRGRFYGDAMIRLRARDMANFGQLYLDGGRWQGKQLVPEPQYTTQRLRSSSLDTAGSGGPSTSASTPASRHGPRRPAGVGRARPATGGSRGFPPRRQLPADAQGSRRPTQYRAPTLCRITFDAPQPRGPNDGASQRPNPRNEASK